MDRSSLHEVLLGHTALGMVFVKIGLIFSNKIFCVKTASLISAVRKHKTFTSN